MHSSDVDSTPPGTAGTDWARVQQWFHAALEHPTNQRDAFLSVALAGEPQLLAEVRSLLRAVDGGDDRFEVPLLDFSGRDLHLEEGSDVGTWTVRRKIGEGGMATVYEAIRRDVDMPKRAALKTVRVVSGISLRARFARERRILATLEHPNIAALLDGGTLSDGRPWFAMEYVEGQRIDHWCAMRKVDVRGRVRLLLQICRAVEAAHARLVVHRDIKPTNVLVTSDGTVKLLDFGIAKLLQDVERHETVTGGLMMTADYASPEHLRGDAVTTRSDIYSLGVVAFELLTGTRPFAMRGQGLRDMMRMADAAAPQLSQVVSELSATGAGLPAGDRLRATLRGDLDSIIAKALQKDQHVRYHTVTEFADDLVAWLESRPVSAHAPSTMYRLGRLVQRNMLMFGVLWVFGVVVATTAVVITAQARQTRIEEQRANERLNEVRTLVRTLVYDVNDRLAEVPGTTRLRADVVRTALQSLDRASSNVPRDPQLQRELAMAYQRAGDVLGNPTENNVGDADGALAAYRRGLAIAQEMVRQQPDDFNALWTKALTLEKIADVEGPTGNLGNALARQRESLALFNQLASLDTANIDRLRAVGISALKLGDLLGQSALTNTGDQSAAIRSYEESLARLDAAVSHGDTTWATRRHTAVVQERLGRLMQARKNFPAARRWLESSLAVRVALVRQSPQRAQAQRDLALAHYLLCGLHLEEGRVASAASECRRSLAIRESLLAADPENSTFMRDMGLMHRKLAKVALATGDTSAALQGFARSDAHYSRLLGNRAGAVDERRDFAHLLLEYAEVAALSALPTVRSEARVNYRRAVASMDSIGRVVPLTRSDSARIQRARALVLR
jgi:non-specific serine/threonine protein kinase/serine/threonine-protein kinase